MCGCFCPSSLFHQAFFRQVHPNCWPCLSIWFQNVTILSLGGYQDWCCLNSLSTHLLCYHLQVWISNSLTYLCPLWMNYWLRCRRAHSQNSILFRVIRRKPLFDPIFRQCFSKVPQFYSIKKYNFERLFCYFLLAFSQILASFANLCFFGDWLAQHPPSETCSLLRVNCFDPLELILRHEFFSSSTPNQAFLRIVSAEFAFHYWPNSILHLIWIVESCWCSAAPFQPNCCCSVLNFSSLLTRSKWLAAIRHSTLESTTTKAANSKGSIWF